MDKDKLYISENIEIFKGKEAETRLRENNDSRFLSDESGIIKVSEDRWQTAQTCERKHWMERGISSSDDRNYYHMENFEMYKSLRGKTYSSAIEIGCGPFTNLRLISGVVRQIKTCSLLDPLIKDYLNHPMAMYSGDGLLIEKYSKLIKFRNRVKNKHHGTTKPRFKGKIPVIDKFDCPAEKLNTDSKYDLIVMINVIEHCYDLNLVFKTIDTISSKGAILIFSDKVYEHSKVSDNATSEYDAAHPLKPDISIINSYLTKNYRPLLRKMIRSRAYIEGERHEWSDKYFIGEKLTV